jgi:hypothetical protein
VTPQEFEALFETQWTPTPTKVGEVAAVILYCDDLGVATSSLVSAGFVPSTKPSPERQAFRKDENTGYTFLLTQTSPERKAEILAYLQ